MDKPHRVRWDGAVTAPDAASDAALDAFEEHRSVLTGVAYRMLGRVADAEDVVQEAWLRWSGAAREDVRDPRGYLVRVTTRLAIDRLRQVQARREAYVGPWLPEPIATDYGPAVPDTAERAVLADSVSLAVLVVLESLSPLERAVFVLREAFGFPFGEIAVTLDRSEASVRQLATRARRHVDEGRPRFTVDPAEQRDLTEKFLAAATGGSLGNLLELLAPDVRLVGDSGGKSKAPLRVIETADKVGRFLYAVAQQPLPGLEARFMEINGRPGLLILSEGRPDTALSLEVTDGRITTVYLVRNPDKLGGLAG
ncbi:RNA polymerase sigma-70 factor [Streptomyces telluris]|uniref:RNA polymerase sigma-70 factor n=1 Tax=Streptomyces telluris TaxID=2720021 RepID=UPI00143A7508|nr:RNA polymerase sigma-70 factor [Streptomyces telluris]